MNFRRLGRIAAALAAGGGLTTGALALSSTSAAAAGGNYGPGAMYQVEVSANINPTSPQAVQGNFWFWAALYPNGTVDYQEADCIHLGGGHATDAGAHDTGTTATWSSNGTDLTISGMNIIGNAEVVDATVPLPTNGTYGHTQGVTIEATGGLNILPQGVPLSYPSENQIAP